MRFTRQKMIRSGLIFGLSPSMSNKLAPSRAGEQRASLRCCFITIETLNETSE